MSSGANLPRLGQLNRRVILDQIRRAQSGISRVELAERAGLTRQAVSNIVARLLADGLVEEYDRAPSRGGKPRTLLRVVPTSWFAAGVHLDPEEVRFVVTDLGGGVVANTLRRVPAAVEPDELIALLARTLQRLVDRAEVPPDRLLGVGAATPGPIDADHRVVVTPPNFPGWTRVPLKEALEEALDAPVVIDNDATAAAIGELWATRAEGSRSFAVVYLGTGVGAGLVLGDRILRGVTGNAGEFGHVVVRSGGRPCFCGNIGCLEAYVSPRAIVTDYREATGQSSTVLDYAGVCQAAAAGDRVARHVLEDAGGLLADAAVSLVNLVDVEEVVLCGRSLRHVADLYGELVEEAVNARSIARSLRKIQVRASRMGDDVAAVGAACLVLDSQLRA